MKKKKWYHLSNHFVVFLAIIWIIVGLGASLDNLNSVSQGVGYQIVSRAFWVSVLVFIAYFTIKLITALVNTKDKDAKIWLKKLVRIVTIIVLALLGLRLLAELAYNS